MVLPFPSDTLASHGMTKIYYGSFKYSISGQLVISSVTVFHLLTTSNLPIVSPQRASCTQYKRNTVNLAEFYRCRSGHWWWFSPAVHQASIYTRCICTPLWLLPTASSIARAHHKRTLRTPKSNHSDPPVNSHLSSKPNSRTLLDRDTQLYTVRNFFLFPYQQSGWPRANISKYQGKIFPQMSITRPTNTSALVMKSLWFYSRMSLFLQNL